MRDKKTSEVPETSTTLLRDVADSQHARWAVFHSRYEPMMQAFMRERFPSLDADDIVQETFVALGVGAADRTDGIVSKEVNLDYNVASDEFDHDKMSLAFAVEDRLFTWRKYEITTSIM